MEITGRAKMEFPLMQLLEERAPIQTGKWQEDGIIGKSETLSVEDVVSYEREEVSEGWGAYDTKSGHPEMPKNVTIPKADMKAIDSMLQSNNEFTTAVVASLVGSTCQWLGMSIKEAIVHAKEGAPKAEAPRLPANFDPKEPFRHSCWGTPGNEQETGKEKPAQGDDYNFWEHYDPKEPFGSINRHGGGNI